MDWALKQPKAKSYIPKKCKALSIENIYDLKLETTTEVFKLFTQRKHPGNYLWYMSTAGKVYSG